MWVATMPLIEWPPTRRIEEKPEVKCCVDNGTRPCEQSGKVGMGQRCSGDPPYLAFIQRDFNSIFAKLLRSLSFPQMREYLTAVPNRIPTFILICALICGTLATRASAGEWTVANVDSLPMDIFGRTVRAGRDRAIVHTAATIGAGCPGSSQGVIPATDWNARVAISMPEQRNSGCRSPGIWGVFPLFIGRENEVRDVGGPNQRLHGAQHERSRAAARLVRK